MTATVKISALPTATVPNVNNDVVPIVQGGATKKLAVGQLGGLLGYARSTQAGDYSTFNTQPPLTDVDATNLIVTFTTPPSGKVMVVYNLLCYSNTGNQYVGIREGLSDVANSIRISSGQGNIQQAVSLPIVITGLTPGSSHSWKMAFATGGGSTTIFGVTNGGMGPSMYVYAVPG